VTAPLLVRVDNRLVHGQVLEAWVPALSVKAIVVADDEAAQDPFAQAAMGLALGEGLSLEVITVSQAAARLGPKGPGVAPGTLLLLREIDAAVQLSREGAVLPKLNLGNVHFRAGRRPVTPTVYLDAGELAALEALGKAGCEIEVRAVPAEGPVFLPAVRERFAAAKAG
jgi:mannose/fructose/N-acetylgalactosamine-specific phosphotransferase system component IIB